MSSSISSSEPLSRPVTAPADSAGWRRCIALFLATAVLLTAGLLTAAFLIDPYDTGRSPLSLKPGLHPLAPRKAAASRGRDPAFSAAIFGNSHIQLLSPEELNARTGAAFVSLIAPGSGPGEALALIDWFLRHRREPARALVIGLDEGWCTPDPKLTPQTPFPFWLSSRSAIDYGLGLLSFGALEDMFLRVGYLTTAYPDRSRPDGYWDYEDGRDGRIARIGSGQTVGLDKRVSLSGGNVAGPFPAATRLEALLAAMPRQTALILVRTPVYVTALPESGSREAMADEACRKAFANLARRRPGTALIDWRTDRPQTRDPNQFLDHTHYRHPVARAIEADIAATLAAIEAAKLLK